LRSNYFRDIIRGVICVWWSAVLTAFALLVLGAATALLLWCGLAIMKQDQDKHSRR
jgi:hypothetical protein